MTDFETDKDGYLLDSSIWTEEIAQQIAQKEGLELSSEHWEVINYVRSFYQKFNTSPAIRPLVKFLREQLGPDKGNSIYLHKLFPAGPAKQATKLAGLPKPTRCT